MNGSDEILSRSAYTSEVERLLDDIDADERSSLIVDLGNRLDEISEAEIASRLGSPKDFVDEYRRSAGIETVEPSRRIATIVQNIISTLLLPFGALVLLSFGGQVLLGPFVIAIEWILARISPRPLRIAWSVLAGALVAEIAYLVLAQSVPATPDPIAVAAGVVVGLLAGRLIYRTSSGAG